MITFINVGILNNLNFMKRNFILGILAVGAICFLDSCKDDETPIAGITFELEEQEVTESDGTRESFHPEVNPDEGVGRVVQVKLVFDRALAGDAVLKFDVDGTARAKATSSEANDFEILDEAEMVTIDDDEITILKGATEATFDIMIYEDLLFEFDEDALNDEGAPYETVVLQLLSVVSGPAKLGATQLEHTMKILEDDAVAFLQWEAQDMEFAAAEVDMDIIFWRNGAAAWTQGAGEGTDFEGINVPAGLGEGNWGVSYTYYSGNSDDLDFFGILFNTAGTLNNAKYTYHPQDGEPLVFEGNYKQVNVNAYSETSPPKIAQTMVKTGINYSSISNLTSFTQGSRLINKNLKLDQSMLKKVAARSKLNSLNVEWGRK
jgi:hypothetical protein